MKWDVEGVGVDKEAENNNQQDMNNWSLSPWITITLLIFMVQ